MRKFLLVGAVIAVVAGCATAKVNKALDDANKAVTAVAKTTNKVAVVTNNTIVAANKVAATAESLKNVATGQKEKHDVIKHDTLWGIDKKHGGDGFGWYGIYRQNRDEIKDYDKIEIGQHFEWSRIEANKVEYRKKAYDEPTYKKK